jgi:hypothetical protein
MYGSALNAVGCVKRRESCLLGVVHAHGKVAAPLDTPSTAKNHVKYCSLSQRGRKMSKRLQQRFAREEHFGTFRPPFSRENDDFRPRQFTARRWSMLKTNDLRRRTRTQNCKCSSERDFGVAVQAAPSLALQACMRLGIERAGKVT